MVNAMEMTESLIEYMGMTLAQFAEHLGVSPQVLYDIKRGKTKKFSRRMLAIITSKMPEVNREWLLKGKGDMVNSSNNVVQSIDQQYITGNITNHMSTVDKVVADELKALSNQVDKLLEIINKMQDE